MMFDTMEELQAHYKAVRQRIEAKKPLRPKPQAVEAPKPVLPLINPVLSHRVIQKYEIKNHAFVKTGAIETMTFVEVVRLVCRHYDLTPKELFARRRNRSLVEARHLCWAIARVMCPQLSLPQIAKRSGGYDHTSVLHGIERAKDRAGPFIKALRSGELLIE
jgi:hypothetical protein